MPLYKKIIVWALRLITGATFIFSGFAKTVDPWGFIYKIQDYLAAWSLDWLPRQVLLCVAIGIAMLEFVSGVMLLLGCMRRASVWVLSLMMAVMLPLTFYIMVANPVEDCGCFGDAWVISNTATFIKNVILAAMLVALIKYNDSVGGLVQPLLQWVVATSCVLYCLVISLVGWWVQPVVDFRPFPVGEPLLKDADSGEIKMVYTREGEEKRFALDELPDETWTFVRREGGMHTSGNLAIFDGDEEVTDMVIASEGPQLLLTVPNPELHNRARSRMCNRLNSYIEAEGGSMLGLVPLSGDSLEAWRRKAIPDYEILTVEDTQLKELARGDAGLVYLVDGVVQWKRNLYSLPGEYPLPDSNLDEVYAPDDGTLFRQLSTLLGVIILLMVIVSLLPNRKKRN